MSATAMQIANDIPWFRMMKWQHAGDGSARCSIYGFRELTPDINNQKKTAADCLPLLVPDRDCRRALAQWGSTHLAVTPLSLAAGRSDSLCFLRARHNPGLFPGLLHSKVTLGKLLDPRGAREAAQEAEPFDDTWRISAQPTAIVGVGQGQEILLWQPETVLYRMAATVCSQELLPLWHHMLPKASLMMKEAASSIGTSNLDEDFNKW